MAGAEMTPTWSSPSCSMPISVPNSGTPRMKLWVPSMGSRYQRVPGGALLGAVFLADQAMVRVARADPLAQDALDALVRDRDERPIWLALDGEVPSEVAQRDLVGRIAGVEGERQPLAQGGFRDTGS